MLLDEAGDGFPALGGVVAPGVVDAAHDGALQHLAGDLHLGDVHPPVFGVCQLQGALLLPKSRPALFPRDFTVPVPSSTVWTWSRTFVHMIVRRELHVAVTSTWSGDLSSHCVPFRHVGVVSLIWQDSFTVQLTLVTPSWVT